MYKNGFAQDMNGLDDREKTEKYEGLSMMIGFSLFICKML